MRASRFARPATPGCRTGHAAAGAWSALMDARASPAGRLAVRASSATRKERASASRRRSSLRRRVPPAKRGRARGVARRSRPSPARPASPVTGPDLVPPFRRTARAGKRAPLTAPARLSRRPRARLAKSDCAMASAHPSRRRPARGERRATSEASVRRSLPRRARPDCCATRAESAIPAPCPRGAIRNRLGFCVPLGAPGPFPGGPGEFGPPRGSGFPSPGGPRFGAGGGAFRQQ